MRLFPASFPTNSLALASLLLLGACSKKSDDPTSTPAATTYATTWTADGKNYTATTSNGAVTNNMLIIGAGQVVSSSESYSLTLSVPASVGTAVIGTSGPYSAGYGTIIGGTTTSYIAASSLGSGTVTVTTLSSTEIIGTFSFTAVSTTKATSTKTVSNGKFAIKR